jgi:hypothetical protein
MRVFVIDGRIGVASGSVQQDQHIILFGRRKKQSQKREPPVCKIGSGFHSLKILFVLEGEHDDGRCGIDIAVGKNSGEDGTHALKLQGSALSLYLRRIADNAKMGRPDFEPGEENKFVASWRDLEIYRAGD